MVGDCVVSELLFVAFAFGQVMEDQDKTAGVLFLVPDGRGGQLDGRLLDIVDDLDVPFNRVGGGVCEQLRDPQPDQLSGILIHQVENAGQRPCDALRLVPARQFLGDGVHKGDVARTYRWR